MEKGKQIADNTEHHSQIRLWRTENTGEIYFTDKRLGKKLILKEYYPIGNTMIYPTRWGKKRAIRRFLQYYIDDANDVIRNMSKRVSEYESYMSSDEFMELPDDLVFPPTVADPKLLKRWDEDEKKNGE